MYVYLLVRGRLGGSAGRSSYKMPRIFFHGGPCCGHHLDFEAASGESSAPVCARPLGRQSTRPMHPGRPRTQGCQRRAQPANCTSREHQESSGLCKTWRKRCLHTVSCGGGRSAMSTLACLLHTVHFPCWPSGHPRRAYFPARRSPPRSGPWSTRKIDHLRSHTRETPTLFESIKESL